MKRATVLLIPLLLLGVLVLVVAAEIPREPGIPEDVGARLDQYVAYSFPPRRATVVRVERARRAWEFGQDMSLTTFGDSVHFQTDTGPTRTHRLSLSALYYPPKELWCALLAVGGESGRPTYSVVFVGLHMDMYNADLVVHEGARDISAREMREGLAAVGCDLGLTQEGPRQ
jgi:hypothetical protein